MVKSLHFCFPNSSIMLFSISSSHNAKQYLKINKRQQQNINSIINDYERNEKFDNEYANIESSV
jgi:hypothetical protein